MSVMVRVIAAILLVLLIISLVPFGVYAALAAPWGLPVPEGAAALFLAGVLVSKVGTAAVFVLLYHTARSAFESRWRSYALLWWVMFITGEIGQAIGPGYTWKEALAGAISETLYVPLSAWITGRLVGSRVS